MAKRIKTITAGRLVIVGCYTIPTPRSSDRERQALREISSAAQERMNLKRSWQKLEVELATNFTHRISTWLLLMTTITCQEIEKRPGNI